MDVAGCSGPQAARVSPRFTRFVSAMSQVLEDAGGDEAAILHFGAPHLRALVRHDDWLPRNLALPLPRSYAQYLLYRGPRVRFTTVAFVWDGGVRTPIHDHMVWGIVGLLRGAEVAERFDYRDGK